MKTWWASASILALCVSPTLAQARDRGHDRRDDRHDGGGRHAVERRHDERGARAWNRESPRVDSRRDSRSQVRDSWRGSDRAPRRGWLSFRTRPLLHPDGYRYGYFHAHGYSFPRYFFDYESYPTPAAVRILVQPAEAEVYVDGSYAGIVDDFDGVFQRLRLTPGDHEITLRLDGYQTWSARIFATPASTVNLHHEMLPGPSGEFDAPGAYEEPEPNR